MKKTDLFYNGQKSRGFKAKSDKIPRKMDEEIWINCHISMADHIFTEWNEINVKRDVLKIPCFRIGG